MEKEIVIKTLVACQHKKTPFNFRKYNYALSIEKVNRGDDWIDYYITHKHIGTIGDRRKGLAVVHSGNVFFLIDGNNNEILRTYGTLIRLFGGYYVSFCGHNYDYQTFPGQDRETEYKTMTIVDEIYDDEGKKLDKEQRDNFIKSTDILYLMTAVEIGESRVFFNNALYDLKDYKLIAKYQKNIVLDGLLENGRCRVRIPEDDRIFIVAVYGEKICRVFTECDFERLRKVLNLNIEKEEETWPNSKEVRRGAVEDMDNVYEYYPQSEISIERYHATSPTTININNHFFHLKPLFTDEFLEKWMAPGMVNHFIGCMACNYYKNNWNTCYLYIPYKGYEQLYESMIRVNRNRPNFITKISKLGTCDILINTYDMYRFECHPFGYITDSGELLYDFDVNNIKW